MRPPIRATSLLVCLLASSALLAQFSNTRFGQPFPLTNTRYGLVSASETQLLSNETGTFLFWLADEGVRVTKLDEPERCCGRLILESLRQADNPGRVFDVVWTGTHFLVAATSYDGAKYSIAGQLLDGNAYPIGDRRTLVETGRTPALAASSSSILLVYSSGRTRARLLTLEGVPTTNDWSLADISLARHDVASNGAGYAVVVSGSDRRETTMIDRQGAVTAQTATSAKDTEIALASDGTDYLLVTSSKDATHAHLLRANGAFERQTTIGGSALATPAVTWSGESYHVALVASFPRELRIARIDREARGVTGEEAKTFLEASAPAIAARSGEVRVAYGTSPVMVSGLPLAVNQPDAATYAAFDQQLHAAASSSEATMVVWGEDRLRIGLRDRDGRWREQAIEDVQPNHAVAESDGNGFLVVAPNPDNSTRSVAIRFDATGAPMPQRTNIDFRATDAVWSGENYVIVGVAEDGVKAMFLSASGIWSHPVAVKTTDEPLVRAVIATDGEEFLVLWELDGGAGGIEGALLTRTLARVSAGDLEIARSGRWPAVTVGNGIYQFAWASGSTVYEQSMHDSIFGSTNIVYRGTHDQKDVQIAVVGNRTFVAWLDPFSNGDAGAMHRIKAEDRSISFRTAHPTAPLILALPDGETGYLGATMLASPPHYGSTRIAMAIGDVIEVPRVTEGPVTTARMENRSIIVEWSALAQNVAGYRLEYRIGDGSWNEIERWFDPNERSMTFAPIRSGVGHSFRARAWSAGGTGPYSNTAVPSAARRRAVR